MATNWDGSYAGKVAFVTGAGSGIGRGIRLAMAAAGADILCADLAGDRGDGAARRRAQARVLEILLSGFDGQLCLLHRGLGGWTYA